MTVLLYNSFVQLSTSIINVPHYDAEAVTPFHATVPG